MSPAGGASLVRPTIGDVSLVGAIEVTSTRDPLRVLLPRSLDERASGIGTIPPQIRVDRVLTRTGFLGHQAHVHGGWEADPLILDDQAIVMRLAGRGPVILTGCGHAGIVNVVKQAQTLTGEARIAAVIGGFHLSGPMFEPIIEPTVAAFDELQPELLMPAHCTGWKAVHRLANRFPEAFVQSAVGTTITL